MNKTNLLKPTFLSRIISRAKSMTSPRNTSTKHSSGNDFRSARPKIRKIIETIFPPICPTKACFTSITPMIT